MHLKVSSSKWQPACLGLNVLSKTRWLKPITPQKQVYWTFLNWYLSLSLNLTQISNLTHIIFYYFFWHINQSMAISCTVQLQFCCDWISFIWIIVIETVVEFGNHFKYHEWDGHPKGDDPASPPVNQWTISPIEAEIKWLPFCRQHHQMCFL